MALEKPPPQAATSIFDVILDELLASILSFAVERGSVFLMEEEFKPVPEAANQARPPSSRSPTSIHYPHSDVRAQVPNQHPARAVAALARLARDQHDQPPHPPRRQGDLLPRQEPCAMSMDCCARLLHEGGYRALSGADRALALRNIETLPRLHGGRSALCCRPGTNLLGLPLRVRPFPRLRRVVLSSHPEYPNEEGKLGRAGLGGPRGESESVEMMLKLFWGPYGGDQLNRTGGARGGHTPGQQLQVPWIPGTIRVPHIAS